MPRAALLPKTGLRCSTPTPRESAAHSGWATRLHQRDRLAPRRHRRTHLLYRDAGITMIPTVPVSEMPKSIAAQGGSSSRPLRRRVEGLPLRRRHGFASADAGARDARRKGYDEGFVLSDHADWPGRFAPSKTAGQSACWPPMATPMRSWPTCKARASRRRRWPHSTEKWRRVNAFAALLTALERGAPRGESSNY